MCFDIRVLFRSGRISSPKIFRMEVVLVGGATLRVVCGSVIVVVCVDSLLNNMVEKIEDDNSWDFLFPFIRSTSRL